MSDTEHSLQTPWGDSSPSVRDSPKRSFLHWDLVALGSTPLGSDSWGDLWQVPSPPGLSFPGISVCWESKPTGWSLLLALVQSPHHCCCCHLHCLCPPARKTQRECGGPGAGPGSPTASGALTALRGPPFSFRPSARCGICLGCQTRR